MSEQIALRQIDMENLGDVDENHEAIEFAVHLTQKPTETWVFAFDTVYARAVYPLKPPVRLADDSLKIIYLPRYAEELPDFFRFLARVVRQTNDEVHRLEEIHTASFQETRKTDFKEALRRIKLNE